MANSISVQVTETSTVDGVRTVVSSNTTTQTSASNFVAGAEGITGSAWTNVSLSSLGDVFALTVVNDATTYSQSVVQLKVDSATVSYLYPGAQAVIPWSGSITNISAKVIGYYSGGAFVSNSFVQAGNGNILYLAQQS